MSEHERLRASNGTRGSFCHSWGRDARLLTFRNFSLAHINPTRAHVSHVRKHVRAWGMKWRSKQSSKRVVNAWGLSLIKTTSNWYLRSPQIQLMHERMRICEPNADFIGLIWIYMSVYVKARKLWSAYLSCYIIIGRLLGHAPVWVVWISWSHPFPRHPNRNDKM